MTHTNPSICEAEATLADLIAQLESIDDKESELSESSKTVALDASVKGGASKAKWEKVQTEILAVQGRQRMLQAAIVQMEGLLAIAHAAEAARTARAQANEAREIAGGLKTIGADMDAAFDTLLASYKKIQDSAVRMDALGFGYGFPRNHLNDAMLIHIAGTLQLAGLDIQGTYGFAEHARKTFGTIMAEHEISTHRKTETVLFPRVEKVAAPPVEVPARDVSKRSLSGLMSFGDLSGSGPGLWQGSE